MGGWRDQKYRRGPMPGLIETEKDYLETHVVQVLDELRQIFALQLRDNFSESAFIPTKKGNEQLV